MEGLELGASRRYKNNARVPDACNERVAWVPKREGTCAFAQSNDL